MTTLVGADTASSVDSPAATVGRFVWELVEIGLPTGSRAQLLGRNVEVLGGSDALQSELLKQLADAGAHARRHESRERDSEGLPPVDVVIDLNLADDFSATDAGQWREQFLHTVHAVQRCADFWSTCADARRVGYVAVTRMGGHMGFGDAPMPQPLGGLWAGFAKGLPREFPTCNVKIIDVAAADDRVVAGHILAEICNWGLFEVAYADGRRFTLQARPSVAGPVGAPLQRDDVVVMTGGGRGIGFALAMHLARTHGCRVVVGGRAPMPDLDDPLLLASAQEFARLREDTLRDAATTRTLAAARRSLDALQRTRDLAANLRRVRSEGLDVVYRSHDVTDPASVRALLDDAGPRLVGVIHNAGIDKPARLKAKTDDTVRDIVDVKVTGLLHVIEALQDRPPRFLSIVGSLTGRWGGMVGQLDYGAANEALSRLGLWARRSLPATSIATLCWPTWDRLGMISNYEATLRYMSALDVDEGVRLWERELLAGTRGEVTFIGDVGPAIVPSLLCGYPDSSGLPGIARLRMELALLGQPKRFVPGRELASVIDAGAVAASGDFLVGGRPTFPVSVALEHCIAAARWTSPADVEALHLVSVNDLSVDLRRLAVDGQTFTTSATARGVGREWHVDVEVLRGGVAALRATLVHHRNESLTAPSPMAFVVPPSRRRHPQVSWTGRTLSPADPETATVSADRSRDAFGWRHSPEPTVGLNAVESLVDVATGHVGELSFRVQRIEIHQPRTRPARLLTQDDRWFVLDERDRPLLTAYGISATTPQEHVS